jgi:HSP20 family protein
LIITAERRSPQVAEVSNTATDGGPRAPLLSEFRYGTWSRSFRFPGGIQRDALEAHYRDGLLTVTAPKAQSLTSVTVKLAD